MTRINSIALVIRSTNSNHRAISTQGYTCSRVITRRFPINILSDLDPRSNQSILTHYGRQGGRGASSCNSSTPPPTEQYSFGLFVPPREEDITLLHKKRNGCGGRQDKDEIAQKGCHGLGWDREVVLSVVIMGCWLVWESGRSKAACLFSFTEFES